MQSRNLSGKLAIALGASIVTFLLADVLIIFPFLVYKGFRNDRLDSSVVVRDSADLKNLIPNDRYIWSYIPGTHFRVINSFEGVSVAVKINSEGFRDEEPKERAGAKNKFVALGDSFTYGWLVEHSDRWDEQLVALLKQKSKIHAASVNLGMWMSTFDQHALLLEDHLPEDCSLVIHAVYPSHLQTINRHQDVIQDGRILKVRDPILHIKKHRLYYGRGPGVVEKRLSFPYALCLFRFLLQRRTLLESSKREIPGIINEEEIYLEQSQERCKPGWRLTELAIRQISDLTRRRNIPYLVVVIPRSFQIRTAGSYGAPRPELLRSTLPQDRIREICTRSGWAKYLDLLPGMKLENQEYYFKNDPHWTTAGHRKAAKLIFDYLDHQGISKQWLH